MSTLKDVSEYFNEKDLPKGHPYQNPRTKGFGFEKSERLDKKPEDSYGYDKDKLKNPSTDKKLNVEN